jgi:hypothetical protein
LEILDSGSRFALNTMRCRASLTRNDDFILLSRVLQEDPQYPISSLTRMTVNWSISAGLFSKIKRAEHIR